MDINIATRWQKNTRISNYGESKVKNVLRQNEMKTFMETQTQIKWQKKRNNDKEYFLFSHYKWKMNISMFIYEFRIEWK